MSSKFCATRSSNGSQCMQTAANWFMIKVPFPAFCSANFNVETSSHREKCEDYIKWLYLSAIDHHHKHTYTGKKAHQGNILFVIWSKLHTMYLSITLSIPTIRFLIHKWSGLSSLSWYTKLHTTTMSPLNIFSLKNNLAGWFFLFPLFSKPKSCTFPFLRFEAWIEREREGGLLLDRREAHMRSN